MASRRNRRPSRAAATAMYQEYFRACLQKKRYDTEKDAASKNCRVYHCPYCGKFHRATS